MRLVQAEVYILDYLDAYAYTHRRCAHKTKDPAVRWSFAFEARG